MKIRSLGGLLRLVASIGLLLLVLHFVDIEPVLEVISRVNTRMVYVGVGLFLVAFSVFARRLQVLLRLTGQEVPYAKLLGINFIGAFFSLLLPSAVGGDIARMYKLSREIQVGAHGLTCVVVDRVLGLFTLLLLAIAALIEGRSLIPEIELLVASVVGLGLIFGAFVIILGFSRSSYLDRVSQRKGPFKWLDRLQAAGESFRALASDPFRLGVAVGLSFLGQVVNILSVIVLAKAVGIFIPIKLFFVIVPTVWLVIALPITVGGLGAREGAFVFLLGRLGVGSAEALALSLLVYSCFVLCGLIGVGGMTVASVIKLGRGDQAAE